ncbi:MAG: CGNR zinc finger domain-containing protein, partial [Caulobacteraceae bacterium]
GEPEERLATDEDLYRWAMRFGFATGEEAEGLIKSGSSGVATDARRLRESFRALFEALAISAPPDPSEVQRVNGYASEGGQEGLSYADGKWALRPLRPLSDGRELLARIARAGAVFIASEDAEHLRRCQSDACVLWFVDRTRNRSRAWCSMERCGARAKAAAYYQRRKEAARTETKHPLARKR